MFDRGDGSYALLENCKNGCWSLYLSKQEYQKLTFYIASYCCTIHTAWLSTSLQSADMNHLTIINQDSHDQTPRNAQVDRRCKVHIKLHAKLRDYSAAKVA